MAFRQKNSLFHFHGPFRSDWVLCVSVLQSCYAHWWNVGNLWAQNCFLYLNDGISGHPDKVSAAAANIIHQKDLELSGLKMNAKKPCLDLMQVGQWLGFIIGTIRIQFRILDKKISSWRLLLMLWYFRELFGKSCWVLKFIVLAVGSNLRLFTRQIRSTFQLRSYWDCKFVLSPSLVEELKFWYLNIDAYNGFSSQPKFIPGAVIYYDASDYVFGGYCLELNKKPVRGMFARTPSEACQSSTFRDCLKLFICLWKLTSNSFVTRKF